MRISSSWLLWFAGKARARFTRIKTVRHLSAKERFSRFWILTHSASTGKERSPDIPVWSLGGSDPSTWIALAAYYPKSPHIVAPGLGIMTITYAKQHGFIPNI